MDLYKLSLSRGVRQGCPLSPFLFVLAVELLACKIRQDKEIQGLNIFQKEIKVSQFADDTTLLNSNRNSVKRAITVLDNFGDLSGLRLNSSKTKVCGLDPGGFAKKNLSDSSGLKSLFGYLDHMYPTM